MSNNEPMQNANDDDFWIDSPMTQDEINDIAKALANDLKGSGHCYTCPNGHPYVIESCGTPMEINECLICKEKIGGQEFLVQSNQFDTKMDQLVSKYQEEEVENNEKDNDK